MSSDPEKAMEVADNEELDESVEEEEGVTTGDKTSVSAQLLKNPAVMAALQGKLDSMAGSPSGYIKVTRWTRGGLLEVAFTLVDCYLLGAMRAHTWSVDVHALKLDFETSMQGCTKGMHYGS